MRPDVSDVRPDVSHIRPDVSHIRPRVCKLVLKCPAGCFHLKHPDWSFRRPAERQLRTFYREFDIKMSESDVSNVRQMFQMCGRAFQMSGRMFQISGWTFQTSGRRVCRLVLRYPAGCLYLKSDSSEHFTMSLTSRCPVGCLKCMAGCFRCATGRFRCQISGRKFQMSGREFAN